MAAAWGSRRREELAAGAKLTAPRSAGLEPRRSVIVPGPNENQNTSISVYVLAANSKDGVSVKATKRRPENKKNALISEN